ncbi:hypothetical protein pb186bvf_014992 [Paramecium bursaria]
MFCTLISTILSQQAFAQTTTTTCQNEFLIYKLDLRSYVNSLGQGSTIGDIDPQALCDLVQTYDYVWLTQIWTPSKFNYQNNLNPTLANDYKITKTIKDYTLDPVLGTAQDLIQLKQSLNQICYHTRFLGEFSFYVGKDSSLLQNKTRFLTIPYNQISANYNSRYDINGFVWAVDDFGRTTPNTAVWNLFSQNVITDIKDIIFRQILQQYNLNGIVFLQPSLGLYSVNTKFYQPEITFFGQKGYLQDFYISFGLQNTVQSYYFMGGEDNLNNAQILINQGLQQIYTGQVKNYDITWALTDFTIDPNGYTNQMTFTDWAVNRASMIPGTIAVFVKQSLPQTQKSCFRVQMRKLSSASIGLGNKAYIVQKGYETNLDIAGHGLFNIFDWKIYNTDDASLDRKSLAFNYTDQDVIEVQYDPLAQIVVFKKFQTNLKYQMYIPTVPSKLQYCFTLGQQANYLISFPFKFSILKSASANVVDFRNLAATATQTLLQFAQILPSLNLLNTTTLNIQIKNIPTNQIVGVGICNCELMIRNQHRWDPLQLGGGAYMILSNGKTLNSEPLLNNKQTDFIYGQGHQIQIAYFPGQRVEFYNNAALYHNVTVTKYIRNVNFCVAFTTINTQFYLTY